MEMQTEMMDGMIDGMNEDADSDEEFFNEILDEVGVEISNGMKLPVSIARHGLNADNLEKTSGRDTIYMDSSGVAHSDENNNNNNNNNNSSNKKGKDSSSSLDVSLQERLDKLRK